MNNTSCFQLIKRTILNSESVPIVEVFGPHGTQLYKGSAMDVPFRICWHIVESYDYSNHQLIIHLR